MNNTINLDGITYKIIRAVKFSHKGTDREALTVTKLNGKKRFEVVRYENGEFSSVVG